MEQYHLAKQVDTYVPQTVRARVAHMWRNVLKTWRNVQHNRLPVGALNY